MFSLSLPYKSEFSIPFMVERRQEERKVDWLNRDLYMYMAELGFQAKEQCGDFLGTPVITTLFLQCRGHEFDPWSGN